ncbi:MAG: 4-hydroxybenzoate octaprenyltransferase [Sphingobacteriia bacterium]|nr:4-hydroxybenzoate octaprenyltransferase [Sphingobacteriia bacterium]
MYKQLLKYLPKSFPSMFLINKINHDKIAVYLDLIRFNKPAGYMLLLWPCLFGLELASPKLDLVRIILFTLCAILMRGVGCIVNDIIDKDIDKKVERTKNRPLASGKVSVKEALTLAILISFFSLLLALIFLPIKSILIAILSLILVVTYPLMKRYINIPQIYLGFTFNIGVLVGYAVHRNIDTTSILLYIACIFWTLGYDTIYALSDIKDDKKIGIKSSAIYFGVNVKEYILGFYTVMTLILLIIALIESVNSLYYLGIMVSYAHFLWQFKQIKQEKVDFQLIFKSNVIVGLILFLSIVLGQI